MRIWTYQDIRDKVLKDTDTQNESFVDSDELVGYCNDAIQSAEAIIHDMYEDYFIKSAPVSLVQSTATYSLPSDIYASKIRKIIYANGATIYEVLRIRDWKKFLDKAFVDYSGSAMFYRYFLQNTDATTGVQLVLTPMSRETSSSVMTMWYLREANRIPLITSGTLAATLATKVDIPQFADFLVAFMKVKVLSKEPDARLSVAATELDRVTDLMRSTLHDMVPDDNDEIEADYSFYEDHV